jgi:hypothetical protein
MAVPWYLVSAIDLQADMRATSYHSEWRFINTATAPSFPEASSTSSASFACNRLVYELQKRIGVCKAGATELMEQVSRTCDVGCFVRAKPRAPSTVGLIDHGAANEKCPP